MEILRLMLHASRITTIVHKGDLLVTAFMPTKGSISALRELVSDQQLKLDLTDRTGEWSGGKTWKFGSLVVADDSNCLNLILVGE
jgi:hypothetical protein